MKRFIDENGIFEIEIPETWRYSLKNGKIHTFQEYEMWRSDTFQISISETKNHGEKTNFLLNTKALPREKIADIEYVCLPETTNNIFITKAWTRIIDDKILIFSYTFDKNPKKEFDNRTLDERFKTVKEILSHFKILPKGLSDNVIRFYRFEMFLHGVAATGVLLNKAIENKAFIEATCILANQIDALLRIGIVLKSQLLNRNNEINSEWIYQGKTDKKKSEKDIYQKALDFKFIDQATFDSLYKLYEDRNRVIHRFIISEITLSEVEEIAFKYYKQLQIINKIIYDLESEQINQGVGMTIILENQDIETKVLNYIKGKIGMSSYFEKKNQ